MKSILVDALRQANGDEGDQALSDSGSFEASHEGIESPANEVLERDDGELELMSTTKALVVQGEADGRPYHDATTESEESADDAIDLDLGGVPVDDEHAVTVVGMMPLPITRQRIPRLARFAPLLCVVLAAAVGGSWLLIDKVGISRADLGTVMPKSRRDDSAGETEGDRSLKPRFPFLDNGQPIQARGTRQ